MISQFIAFFNYSDMATLAAVSLADLLQRANLDALWLLVGFVAVTFILDLIITGAIAKWAIFALIVTFAIKYQKDAGIGTVIALMLPYVIVLCIVWTLFLAAWHLLGLPWGL